MLVVFCESKQLEDGKTLQECNVVLEALFSWWQG
jgi:hypothetical protein